jgi:hypothetical protein
MCKFANNTKQGKIDKCMVELIENLKWIGLGSSKEDKWETVACCCGHGKYPMSIIVKSPLSIYLELVSDTYLKRKKRFYRRDSEGYYYIPELQNADTNLKRRKRFYRKDGEGY